MPNQDVNLVADVTGRRDVTNRAGGRQGKTPGQIAQAGGGIDKQRFARFSNAGWKNAWNSGARGFSVPTVPRERSSTPRSHLAAFGESRIGGWHRFKATRGGRAGAYSESRIEDTVKRRSCAVYYISPRVNLGTGSPRGSLSRSLSFSIPLSFSLSLFSSRLVAL